MTAAERAMKGRLEFRIHGMDCADEVAILKREVGPLVGAADERLMFDVMRGKMTVIPGEPSVSEDQIRTVVGKTGMRAEVWRDVQPGTAERSFWERRGRTVLTAASGVLLVSAFVAHALDAGAIGALGSEAGGEATEPPIAAVLLYIASIAAGGWFVAGRAVRALLRMRPDMNLLMMIAVLGAALIGEWFEAGVVTFLFAVSLALESWSVGRARRAVDALLAIAPDTAWFVSSDGSVIERPAAELHVGDVIRVKPGDRVALDGAIRKGSTTVNQAPITGESMPVEKAPGSEVFAGTINGEGAIEVEVSRVAGESTLAQIIRMVGESQSRRAPSEQWVDRFAAVYTPAVLALAFLIAVAPPLLGYGTWNEWTYKALVLLVIGCPCALVVSTPVSIVASLAAAARNGVLVKGGAFMEAPSRLQAVAMDKTGTLTEGAPRVVDVEPLAEHTRDELLSALSAIEAHSDHPLGRAIMQYVAAEGVPPKEAEDVVAVTGRGITARIDGKTYWAGSHRYVEERGQETPAVHDRIEELSADGKSVVIMSTGDHVCGFVTLADAVRPASAAAVRALQAAGVTEVVMLTGDNQATADRIAREVGITSVQAELLPADKVAAVEQLVARYGTVAMIGDGVNDAPAMGRATIGIAMGAAGSDAAIEAADIALMTDDLGKLPWLVRHSKRTMSIIRQNVVLSLGVKLFFVVLTFAGMSALWMAIAADMGVTLVVIANALRLLSIQAVRV